MRGSEQLGWSWQTRVVGAQPPGSFHAWPSHACTCPALPSPREPTVPPVLPVPPPRAAGDALHAYELLLALNKLNFSKLRALHSTAREEEDPELQVGPREPALAVAALDWEGWQGPGLTSSGGGGGGHGGLLSVALVAVARGCCPHTRRPPPLNAVGGSPAALLRGAQPAPSAAPFPHPFLCAHSSAPGTPAGLCQLQAARTGGLAGAKPRRAAQCRGPAAGRRAAGLPPAVPPLSCRCRRCPPCRPWPSVRWAPMCAS